MKRFNVRVYGLLVNENSEILVSDESRYGHQFTKFPGGGVEFGEGLHTALVREFREEMELEIDVKELFYVNDFLQISAFDPNHQLISFYYFVSPKHPLTNLTTAPSNGDGESQRWISIQELTTNDVTFPLDKCVVEKLKAIEHLEH